MSRTMEKIIPVRISTDAINCYATIQRAMITATTACLRLGDTEHAEEFCRFKDWSSEQYNKVFQKHVDEKKGAKHAEKKEA